MKPATQKEIDDFRKTPPALVVLDLGNSGLKAMVAGRPETETFLEHEIVFPASNQYERMTKRARLKSVQYKGAEFFKKLYKDGSERRVMVGEGVTANARTNKVTGEVKYKEGYFDVLMAGILKRLFPNGHQNIWIALATPFDAIDYMDDIQASVGGTHKIVNLDGDTVIFKVRQLTYWGEPEGGFMRFMERNERANNAINIQPSQRIIVIDIGGKISSMTVVGIGDRLEPFILYAESPDPFDLGIIDVKENLARELKGLYSDRFKLFKTAGGIPSNMLEDGIQTGRIELSGEPFDITQARMNALANILDEIESRYENQMQGGLTAAHIVVTGGGGGLLIPILRLEILNHNSVHLADDKETIQFANLRGGAVAMIEWLEAKGYISA